MNNNAGIFFFLLFAVAAVFVVRQALKPEETFEPLRLPPMMAEGWVNVSDPPSDAQLRGKLVILDAWATWCGPCKRELPGLIEFHKQLPGDVVLIGLTNERGSEAATVRDFVTSMEGMNWPIGYGSQPTLDALGNEAFPTYYLFGRDGMLLWQGHQKSGLEEAVVKAMGM